MAEKKVLYTEPIYFDDDLMLADMINGSYFENMNYAQNIASSRYDKNAQIFNALNAFQASGGVVHADFSKQIKQLSFSPEYGEYLKDNYIRLVHTPGIQELKFLGKYDFYNGDYHGAKRLDDFPFGFIIATEQFAMSGYDGIKDGIAIAGNGQKDLVHKEIGKNINTYDKYKIYKDKPSDSFNVVILGKDLRHEKTISYPLLEYPLYKISYLFGRLFVINYSLQKNKVAFLEGGNKLYEFDFSAGEYLKFFRTRKSDLVYTNKEMIFFDKISNNCYKLEFAREFKNISFNPILKSICTEKDDLYTVYRTFGGKLELLSDNVPINEAIKAFAVQWSGNLEYDYAIKNTFNKDFLNDYMVEQNYRGHHMLRFGEYEADFNIGYIHKNFEIGMGSVDDFHLNNTDDADMGLSEHLDFRRKIAPHLPINIAQTSYARTYQSSRQIIFYSLDFDNNFGQLYLFSY